MRYFKDLLRFLMSDKFQWAAFFLGVFILLLAVGLISEKSFVWLALGVVGGDAYRKKGK